MSVVVYEMLDSMSGSISNDYDQGETREVRRSYVIGQCDGFNDVVEKISEYAPPYVNSDGAGIYWRRTRLDVAGIGNKYFQVTATYATLVPKPPVAGSPPPDPDFVPGAISWDTSGHTEHITQALKTTRIPADAPDFQDAINVSGSSVNGLNVVRPCLRYSETWIQNRSWVSAAVAKQIQEITGTVYELQFREFEAETVLFLGARAAWQGDLPYVAVTYDFEVRPEETVYFNEDLPPVDKKGWQYVWFLYETSPDANRLVQKAIAAYCQDVYATSSWDGMGILQRDPYTPEGPAFGRPVAPGGNGFSVLGPAPT